MTQYMSVDCASRQLSYRSIIHSQTQSVSGAEWISWRARRPGVCEATCRLAGDEICIQRPAAQSDWHKMLVSRQQRARPNESEEDAAYRLSTLIPLQYRRIGHAREIAAAKNVTLMCLDFAILTTVLSVRAYFLYTSFQDINLQESRHQRKMMSEKISAVRCDMEQILQ